MAITLELNPEASAAIMGRLLCWAAHPLALELGTIAPLVPCCRSCNMYPAGHPTSWTFPA